MLCFGDTCPFCNVSSSRGFRIVTETDELIAFHDRSPAAELHLLIIPRQHIRNIKDINTSHLGLLHSMVNLGRQLLKDHGYNIDKKDTTAKLGFHVPPFNSVHHLHMHVIGPLFKNRVRQWKYTTGMPWYIDATDVIARLESKM